MRILVTHRLYGWDTGCCGHVIELEDLASGESFSFDGKFDFDHPYGEDHRKGAEDLVREVCGDDHVKDLLTGIIVMSWTIRSGSCRGPVQLCWVDE